MSDTVTNYSLILSQKLSPNMMRYLMCFSHWDEPPGFTRMRALDRRELMNSMKAKSTFATVDNHWVWFGAYDIGGRPVYDNKSLVRQIYTAIFGELVYGDTHKQRRLTNTYAKHLSDVNVFRYLPSMGSQVIPEGLTQEEVEKVSYDTKLVRRFRFGVNLLKKYEDTITDRETLMKILEAERFSEEERNLIWNKRQKELFHAKL